MRKINYCLLYYTTGFIFSMVGILLLVGCVFAQLIQGSVAYFSMWFMLFLVLVLSGFFFIWKSLDMPYQDKAEKEDASNN